MDQRNTTDVLRGDLRDNQNVTWLYERFVDVVKSFIESHLASDLQLRADIEVLAETTFRQAIDGALRDERFRANSDVFHALLMKIARNRVCSAVEMLRAEKRNNSGVVSLEETLTICDREITPDEQAAVRETMRASIAELLNEDKPERWLINLLGCCLGLKASDIQDVMRRHPEKFPMRSAPTIHTQI